MKHVYHVTAIVTYRGRGVAAFRSEEKVNVLGNGNAFVAGRKAARILKRRTAEGEHGEPMTVSRVVVESIDQGSEIEIR